MHCEDPGVRDVDGRAVDGEPGRTADDDVDLLAPAGVVVLGKLVVALDDQVSALLGDKRVRAERRDPELAPQRLPVRDRFVRKPDRVDLVRR